MIYIFNIAPGINIRLFCEWFLKNQFSYNDKGFTLKFDDSGFNFIALKNDKDVTVEYITKYSKNFINGLPKPIYDELESIPKRIFDLSDSDLFFGYVNDLKRNDFYKLINKVVSHVETVKQKNVIISGLFLNETIEKLKKHFNTKIYNIIIDKNISFQNSESGILNKISYLDTNKSLLEIFNEAWKLLENNKYETFYIENIPIINNFNQSIFKQKSVENFEFKKELFNIIKTL